MKRAELLAPAGNLESFYSAINNGADAVYLGLDDFNARGNIENFNLENIEDVIKHAHLFGVKVYLTLNILFDDSEIANILNIVSKLLKFNVDAFIVQDLGLAYCIKKKFPNAVLHASTQMGICNLEGAKFVQNFGFSRVVLARETSLQEITRIHENCDIEIEYFVQGALCVSYSGNCYISSLSSGASGNRGKCKQFCRLPYVLTSGKEKREGYFLSAKDFCMLDRLQELAEAGVISFKIEGRARRAGYVGEAVAVYREALDGERNLIAQKDRLKTVFNRGDYIEGYFNDDKKIDSFIQGHRGLKIGQVIKVNNGKKFNEVTIKSKHKISRGDGLKFILQDNEIASIGVNDVKEIAKDVYQITTKAVVKNNCEVSLTLNSLREQELKQNVRKIKIKASFYAKNNDFAKIILDYNNEAIVEMLSEEKNQEAINQALTREEVISQLSKGCEMFELDFDKIELGNVFIRKSVLNDIRRKTIEKLKDAILENYNKQNIKDFVERDFDLSCFDKEMPTKQIYFFNDIAQLKNINLKNAKLVYCPKEYNRILIKKVCDQIECELYLNMPIFANEADIKLFKLILEDNPNLNIFANNYYALNLNNSRKVIVSGNLNVFNSYSVKALQELGIEDIIVSVEVNESLKNNGTHLYGLENYKPIVMNFLHCPFKEHFASKCDNCKFKDGVKYIMQNNKSFELIRIKAVTCNFALQSQEVLRAKFAELNNATFLF